MTKDDLSWRVINLQIDEPSVQVGDYFKENFPHRIMKREMTRGETFIKRDILENRIRKALKKVDINGKQPVLTLYGHGDCHHFTYGLCRVLADRRSEDYGYIHIDQHHDMWYDDETEDRKEINVMNRGEIVTGWPKETGLRRKELLKYIRAIKQEKNIIGADILGWSAGAEERSQIYTIDPGSPKGKRSFSLYTAIAAELMGVKLR